MTREGFGGTQTLACSGERVVRNEEMDVGRRECLGGKGVYVGGLMCCQVLGTGL